MNELESNVKELIILKYGNLKKFSDKINMPWTTLDSILKRGIANSNISNVLKITRELEIDSEQLIDGKIIPIRNTSSTQTVREEMLYLTQEKGGSQNKKIGTILKEARTKAGISIEQISHILIEKGYKASIKTIYSWENGNSNPGPDALLEMCDIYKIENILKTFGYDGYKEDGSIQLNLDEIEHIEKYRSIDPHGKELVNVILNKEYERCEALRHQSTITPMLKESTPDCLILNAAHERTDIPESERTPDLAQQEEDIMDDENF